MGPTWGRQNSGGPHVGPMNLAIWVATPVEHSCLSSYVMSYAYYIDISIFITDINWENRAPRHESLWQLNILLDIELYIG